MMAAKLEDAEKGIAAIDDMKVDNEKRILESRNWKKPPEFLNDFVKNTESMMHATPLMVDLLSFLTFPDSNEIVRLVPEDISDKSPKEVAAYFNTLDPQLRSDIFGMHDEVGFFSTATQRLPSIMLTAIVTEFEVLVSEIAKFILFRNPNLVTENKKEIKINEIFLARSIDDLKEKIIDREIDDLLRRSTSEQIDRIQVMSGVNFSAEFVKGKKFLEIFERRNTIIHARGRASQQYINAIHQIGASDLFSFKIGDSLPVTTEYFSESLENIQIVGILIILRVWWQLSKSDRKTIDGWIITHIFNLVKKEKYENGIRFSNMLLNHKYQFKDKAGESSFVLNRAQCLKWAGDNDGCLNLLRQVDWSTYSPKYLICVHALRDEFSLMSSLIRRHKKSCELDFGEYCDWPMFKEARENTEFCDAVEEIFGQRPKSIRKLPDIFQRIKQYKDKELQPPTNGLDAVKQPPARGRKRASRKKPLPSG